MGTISGVHIVALAHPGSPRSRTPSGPGGSGFPEPKYHPGDEQKDPDKYAKELKEYRAAVLKYAIANPTSKEGMEAELTDLDPSQKWFALTNLWPRLIPTITKTATVA